MLGVNVGQQVEDLFARVVGNLSTVLAKMQWQLVDALDAEMIGREGSPEERAIYVILHREGVLDAVDLGVTLQTFLVRESIGAIRGIVSLDLRNPSKIKSLERASVPTVLGFVPGHTICMRFGKTSEMLACCSGCCPRIHALLKLILQPVLGL